MILRRSIATILGGALVAPFLATGAEATPRTRSRAWASTGSGGRTWSGQSSRTTDRAAGTTSRSATQTGPNGGTRNVEGSGTFSDGSYNGTRSVTGPQGNTRTNDVTLTRP
jgi:hypothetical protein